MKKQILILSLCIALVFCDIPDEDAPVTDEERRGGFACKSWQKTLKWMKEGDVRINYKANFCGKATCSNGRISFETCPDLKDPQCHSHINLMKPYPACCVYVCA